MHQLVMYVWWKLCKEPPQIPGLRNGNLYPESPLLICKRSFRCSHKILGGCFCSPSLSLITIVYSQNIIIQINSINFRSPSTHTSASTPVYELSGSITCPMSTMLHLYLSRNTNGRSSMNFSGTRSSSATGEAKKKKHPIETRK